MEKHKKIILIIIDSFHPKALYSCFAKNMVPALSFLKEKGSFRDDCLSVYPTMTSTASSSIVTGKTPDIHEVPGIIWFNRKEKRFINYGATFRAIWKIGLLQVARDLVFNLNKRQLSKRAKTVFETLEEAGFSTAAINFFIYRGKNSFTVKVPWLISLLNRFKLLEKLLGPKILFFGEICNPAKLFKKQDLPLPMGPFHKFGVNDEFSGIISSQIIKEGLQPDFMLTYLPDTDAYAHKHNPVEIEESLAKADFQVQRILNSFPSWEKALEENVFIVVGDHAQSLIKDSDDFEIDLGEKLLAYKQAKLGKKNFIKKEIAICPNERMAYIYLLENKDLNLTSILKLLRRDKRLDQICWRELREDKIYYHVARGGEDTGLIFWRGGPYQDSFRKKWDFMGNLQVVDGITVSLMKKNMEEKAIVFKDYPDVFSRIASILDCAKAGEIVVNARPGYEFGGEAAPLHPGCGSHGSLHIEDSLVPLIVAGNKEFKGIKRITDIAPAVLRYLGLTDNTTPTIGNELSQDN